MHDLDLELSDVVLFELPDRDNVDAFRDRLRARWDGWSDADGDLWLFSAQLDQSRDLAPLLREAQELVAELGLDAIRFYLDGRVYLLDAPRSSCGADLAA